MAYPLVSVPIVTYNSSMYIIECLDSIFNQTYQNVELIISDDCSTDNTVEICRNWLKKHGERFVRFELMTAKINTGIVTNKARAEKLCLGDYIKPIDGDDFIDSCFLTKCMQVFFDNPECVFVFTNSYSLFEKDKRLVKNDSSLYRTGHLFKELFMMDCVILTSSWIFKKRIAEEFEYDKTIWLDDYLRILKMSNKYEFYWIDEYLAYYRNHNKNSSEGSIRLFLAFIDSISQFKNYFLFEKRKNLFLNLLSDAAEVEKPSYLIRMAFVYHRFSYFKRYYSILRRNFRVSIKKTKVFKSLRYTWLWKKLKGEI